jgi:hypothetical protein
VVQKPPSGQFILNEFKEFCSRQLSLEGTPALTTKEVSFGEFLVFFNIIKKRKESEVT